MVIKITALYTSGALQIWVAVIVLFNVCGLGCVQAAPAISWSLAVGVQPIHYQELDTQGLTDDGILNSERGKLPSLSFGLRWQQSTVQLSPAPSPWFAWSGSYAVGGSDYDGYLQTGQHLQSYQSYTENVQISWKTKMGWTLPLELPSGQGYSGYLEPYVFYQQLGWERELDQYTEHYHRRGHGIGLQWRQDLTKDWQVLLSAARTLSGEAEVDVSGLGFEATVDATWQQYDIGAYRRLNRQQMLGAVWRHSQYRSDASVIVNGYQSPSSQEKRQALMLIFSCYF